MILYYAMGGGLGHLVRARAVLHTLGLEARTTLLTASPYARDPRVVGDLPVELSPGPAGASPGDGDRVAHRAWLAEVLHRLDPEEVFVDTFPFGLLGELAELLQTRPRVRLTYVGRLLRWPTYTRDVPASGRVRFARAYIVEPLHADHQAALQASCDELLPLEPRDPPVADGATAAVERALPERFWLVVHSGPPEEIAELVAYARDLQRIEADPAPIVVSSPCAELGGDGAIYVDLHPATPLYARAVRVVSACGYNVMRQMAPHRERHRFLPFPRRYDDQFTRAARRREAG